METFLLVVIAVMVGFIYGVSAIITLVRYQKMKESTDDHGRTEEFKHWFIIEYYKNL